MSNKIFFINGNPVKAKNDLDRIISQTITEIQNNETEVFSVDLRNKEIRQCIGCFDCWLKTPGICRFKDDVEDILRKFIQADLVIFTSPLIMGMYSALLKRLQDRMLPAIHPYMDLVNNEIHHRKRYEKYPKVAFIFDENDATPEEIENVRFIHQRIALNIHSELLLFESIRNHTPKELSHEISCL